MSLHLLVTHSYRLQTLTWILIHVSTIVWMMWLQLKFPIYLIFIATSLIIASCYSTITQRLTAHRALPVLATFFLLSYKILKCPVSYSAQYSVLCPVQCPVSYSVLCLAILFLLSSTKILQCLLHNHSSTT